LSTSTVRLFFLLYFMGVINFFFRRGIPAQPILNGYCGNYEVGMAKSLINHPAFNYETIHSELEKTSSSSSKVIANLTSQSSSIFHHKLSFFISLLFFAYFCH